jgi:hypothetical protein
MAGGILTSPAALKVAIDSGRIPVSALQKVAPAVLQAMQKYPGAIPSAVDQSSVKQNTMAPEVDTPAGLNPNILSQFKAHPQFIDTIKDERLKALINQLVGRKPAGEAKSQEYMHPDHAKQQFLEGN